MDENTHMYSMDTCRNAGFLPKTVYKGHRPENLIEFVSQGMGVSLLMRRQADFYKNPGITVVELAQQVSSHVSLLYRNDRPLSAAARVFIDFLRAYVLKNDNFGQRFIFPPARKMASPNFTDSPANAAMRLTISFPS